MKRTESLVTITPSDAEELLTLNTFEGQRPVSEQRVSEYASKMVDGRFHVGSVATFKDKDGSTVLIDGQHSCWACLQSDTPFRAVRIEFESEKGDGIRAKSAAFSQFNIDYARSQGQIAWTVAQIVGMGDYPRRCVTTCCSALGWLQAKMTEASSSVDRSKLSRDEQAQLLSPNRKHCEFVRSVAWPDNSTPRHMHRASVVAAMISSHRLEGDGAAEFWEAVRDGELLTKNDPRFRLREFLVHASVRSTGAGGCNSVSHREVYVKSTHAWNTWAAGLTTKTLKYFADAPIPKMRRVSRDTNGRA